MTVKTKWGKWQRKRGKGHDPESVNCRGAMGHLFMYPHDVGDGGQSVEDSFLQRVLGISSLLGVNWGDQ